VKQQVMSRTETITQYQEQTIPKVHRWYENLMVNILFSHWWWW